MAFVDLEGELLAREACPAWASFRRQRNPDDARLVVGQRYPLLGLNRPNGEWAQVLLPDAAPPARRWVATGCGTLRATAAPARRPLFDTVDAGPADPSPPPPPLDAFDRAVLELCGPWGSRPRRAAFRALLGRPELAADLRRIDRALGGVDGLEDALTELWFDAGGFTHVFCGEPRPDGLAGLHYRGRLLDLQERGLASLASEAECRADIEPPVYSIGLRYRLDADDASWRTACPKGYASDLGAVDLLIAATRAALGRRGTAGTDAMCLLEMGRGEAGYHAVLVLRDGAIRTFYPDPTPRCDKSGRPAACAC